MYYGGVRAAGKDERRVGGNEEHVEVSNGQKYDIDTAD